MAIHLLELYESKQWAVIDNKTLFYQALRSILCCLREKHEGHSKKHDLPSVSCELLRMPIVPGKRPNEHPREQSSMTCRMLREQLPMTKPRAVKAVGPVSGEQPRKEPREPSASVKDVLKLNMSNDAQEKHCLQGTVNAPPKQPKAQVCNGREMHAAAKVRTCVWQEVCKGCDMRAAAKVRAYVWQEDRKWCDMRAAANEQKNHKWRDMRAAAKEQKNHKWR
eukprot:9359143-Ditylum_brightwellii.AAC.1